MVVSESHVCSLAAKYAGKRSLVGFCFKNLYSKYRIHNVGNFQNMGKVFITLYAVTCDNKSMCNTAKCELLFILDAGPQFQALKKRTACEKTEGKGLPPIKGEDRKLEQYERGARAGRPKTIFRPVWGRGRHCGRMDQHGITTGHISSTSLLAVPTQGRAARKMAHSGSDYSSLVHTCWSNKLWGWNSHHNIAFSFQFL